MDELARSEPQLPQQTSPAQYCRYCGARLAGGLYFCLSCATPYQDVEMVLSPMVPVRLTAETLIARKAPRVWTLFFTYLGVCIVGAVGWALISHARGGEDPAEHMGTYLIVLSALMFITTCVFSAIYWRSLVVQLKQIGFLHWAAYAALAALAPLLTVNYFYHRWLSELAGLDADSMGAQLRQLGLSREALIFLVCVMPAVMEEIAFRGLVQQWLQTAIKPWQAIVLASALFMALHFSVLSAPYLFCVGMLLGWAKWKTGSLYPSILTHLIHNFVVLEYF